MKYTIYIPSKGRYENNHTAKLLKEYEIPFKLVVEPQEAQHYFNTFGGDNILIIPENDKGIAYVRNWIKNYSKNHGEYYHWAVDDDIRFFRRRVDKKNIKVNPSEVFLEVEEEVNKYTNVAQAGISHFAFAFSSKNDICLNRQIYSVMLINNETPFWFRDGVIDDIDYSLQCLYGGWCTLFFTRIMFEPAPSKGQKGGNIEFYMTGVKDERTIGLAKAWKDIKEPRLTKTGLKAYTGHIWKSFKQHPELKEKNES